MTAAATARTTPATNTAPHPSERRGLIPWLMRLISRTLAVLVVALFFGVIVEWVGMAVWYQDTPNYTHAQTMFATELSYLQDAADDTETLKSGLAGDANSIVGQVITFTFIDSGVMEALAQSRVVLPTDTLMEAAVKEFITILQDYLIAAMYVIMTFHVRLAILTLSLPVFVVFGFVGIIDGLVMRDLRKFRGSHESSFVYHIAKGMAVPIMVTGCILYISLPFTIHPNLVITPYAILFALALRTMAHRFKKHL